MSIFRWIKMNKVQLFVIITVENRGGRGGYPHTPLCVKFKTKSIFINSQIEILKLNKFKSKIKVKMNK